MELTLRPATSVERLYIYDQHIEIAKHCGCPGDLFCQLDDDTSIYLPIWSQFISSEDTPAFRKEFKTVLHMLRFNKQYGPMLENFKTMVSYCHCHPQGIFRNGFDYAFRADTLNYSYMIHCVPYRDDEESHVRIYCYRRDCLDQHMKQAEKGVRFITPHYEEKFRVSDGDMVRIITKVGTYFDIMVRYVDDCHAIIDRSFYHICEYAELLEHNAWKVIPMRSTLPEKCYSVTADTDMMIIIVKGEAGHYIAGKNPKDTSREGADAENKAMGITKAQESAMIAGSMFGWEVPAADPQNYDEQGRLIIRD